MSSKCCSRAKRVVVKEVVSGRYDAKEERPIRWDSRVEGVDVIITTTGEEITLNSNGGQSTPKPGWEILLEGGCQKQGGKNWTLYGIRPQSS